ncbi:hypothetical protein TL16_g11444 [Triparma laevis f. inornata]|uniref:RMT2 domain-containing protein n=1 Tax=Triparma laevis f. inornata TaxID=1714386 RepID=A0A9W7BLQ0_9STRA|nr:hypothetical protein TL16_g11444 [Triparma laevis f. inornata]
MPLPTQAEVLEFHKLLATSLEANLSSGGSAGPSPDLLAAATKNPGLIFQANEIDGVTPLIVSAKDMEHSKWLLEEGAPWNAVDRAGKCAGNHSTDHNIQPLIDLHCTHATRSELILSQTLRNGFNILNVNEAKESTDIDYAPCTKKDYLQRDIKYSGTDQLLDSDNDAVMMEWERPLMSLHSEIICQPCTLPRVVLNVGFGMGIIDTFIQERLTDKDTHVIIEAHPGVYAKMKTDGWCDKPNVIVKFGKWQDVMEEFGGAYFTGIFFDTYAESHLDMEDFHAELPRILKRGGIYSFFNGLCPDNIFFHGVACNCVKIQLESLEFEVEFEGCEIKVKEGDWEGTRRKYWHFDQYFLPVCRY